MNKGNILLMMVILVTSCAGDHRVVVRVGAKHFNEGYVLGEVIARMIEEEGFAVDRVFNLGGTTVSFEALRKGEIDVYPEYSGTIAREILKSDDAAIEKIRGQVKERYDLAVTESLGFNNTYALLMKEEKARREGIETISDLRAHGELSVGLSYEFMEREDGWRNLARHYGLPHQAVGMEHGLAYQAVVGNQIDVTDAYSTDGEISRHRFILLKDDMKFFTAYEALAFYRSDLPAPVVAAIQKLEGLISGTEMQQMNEQALAGVSHAAIATNFLRDKNLLSGERVASMSSWDLLWRRTAQHIQLTFFALLAAIVVAVPTGLVLYSTRKFVKPMLYASGILQTIPSIALLALMLPLFGIGKLPALVALFLYALLPILRNLMIGLNTIDPQLKKIAVAIGLNRWQRVAYVEFPLALPTLLTGIRTAAVISVGTATLAAFIGAGGLGEFIVTGLALNNTTMIMWGAVPSALLAVLIELMFEGIERFTVPGHLRQKIFTN